MLVDLTLRCRDPGNGGARADGLRSSAPTAPESICGFPLAADALRRHGASLGRSPVRWSGRST